MSKKQNIYRQGGMNHDHVTKMDGSHLYDDGSDRMVEVEKEKEESSDGR